MTPEQKRIELLESRVKNLEEALLYLSNTLAMHGLIEPVEKKPATQAYDDGRAAQEELFTLAWDWQE